MMKAPEIKVGDVFTRIDRNGKTWTAEVINRTDCFVDVKKTQPYQIRVLNNDESGKYGCCHYEDPAPTYERAMINEEKVQVETGKMIKGLFGDYPETKYVGTGKYFIDIKEEYSKSYEYDKSYVLTKYMKKEVKYEG